MKVPIQRDQENFPCSEMSLIRRYPLFEGVPYSEVSLIQRCPLWEVLLYIKENFKTC